MNNKFYGTNKQPAFSYLEFGSIDMCKGKKHVWDFRMHQQAYDWLMHARYSNDLITYIKLCERVGVASISEIAGEYREGIHHPDDFLVNYGKLCALAVMSGAMGKASFFELGQTLFGCIEGMEFCQKVIRAMDLEFPYLSLENVHWRGVDISDFFNRLAVLMHARYDVEASDVLKAELPADVFFAKGVTLLYAIREPLQLCDTLNYGKLSLFDYSFAMDGPQEMTLGTGKQIVYLAYDDCKKQLEESGKQLYVRRSRSNYDASSNRIFVDGVYGDERHCRKYIELDTRIRTAVEARIDADGYSTVLFNGSSFGMDDWAHLADYVDATRTQTK
ncbi:MAG: hypothetical protein A2X80_06645 [Geobacteraceae bacterium GWB2_52_12]|nr:MAG: hypothetical protein A2X80_06645 [Geobacteraceae bacterium GWB2_52_12]